MTQSRIAGQAAVEYLVVLALVALFLVLGPDSPVERLVRAFDARFSGFSHAISLP